MKVISVMPEIVYMRLKEIVLKKIFELKKEGKIHFENWKRINLWNQEDESGMLVVISLL